MKLESPDVGRLEGYPHMNQETKQCQNCKKDFTVEPEDFNFYEKISGSASGGKVPPPTFFFFFRM